MMNEGVITFRSSFCEGVDLFLLCEALGVGSRDVLKVYSQFLQPGEPRPIISHSSTAGECLICSRFLPTLGIERL